MAKRTFYTVVRYIIVIITLVALGYLAYLLLGTRERVSYSDPPPAVIIAPAYTGHFENTLSLSGTVQADALIPVIPFVAGTIEEYHVQEGDVIEKGAVIATIGSESYQQQMSQAQAAYVVAQATYDRIERLYAAKATTQQNLEQAKAQRDAAKAQLELAQLQLGYAKVEAPISGTVISTPLSKGNVASNQQPIAIMADVQSLIVELNVSERYYDIMNNHEGQLYAKVTRLSAYHESLVANAVIEHVGSYVQPQSKTFPVRCRLTDGHESFTPGMHVQVELVYESFDDVPLIRQSDRTIDGNVYVYDEETSTARWQQLIPVAENDELVVVPDAMKQAQFIVDGHHSVFDGQPVTVIEVTRR